MQDRIFRACLSRARLLTLGLAAALSLSACARVKPYERQDLARKCMQSPFSRQQSKSAYDDKVLQTATGAESPGGIPGGGCGCTR